MKMRYYLRGLGLGMIITTVFFLLGNHFGQTMSDEKIKERAKELGMIESTILSDITTTMKETKTFDIETEMLETGMSETETSEIDIAETSEIETEMIKEDVAVENKVEKPSETVYDEVIYDGNLVRIVVNEGENAYTVSQRLYKAGLVEDPNAFCNYLTETSHDKIIVADEYWIPIGTSWEGIAELLSSWIVNR